MFKRSYFVTLKVLLNETIKIFEVRCTLKFLFMWINARLLSGKYLKNFEWKKYKNTLKKERAYARSASSDIFL